MLEKLPRLVLTLKKPPSSYAGGDAVAISTSSLLQTTRSEPRTDLKPERQTYKGVMSSV